MSEEAHHPPAPPAPRSPADPFSLQAYLDRQHAEFAGGPTMAEILAKADRLRAGGVDRELIAEMIRADRGDRAE